MLTRRSLFQININALDSDFRKSENKLQSSQALEKSEQSTQDERDEILITSKDMRTASVVAPIFTLALAACGGDSPGDSNPSAPPPPIAAAVKKPATDAEAARFLSRAQFSVSSAEMGKVREIGYVKWLDAEMAKPISEIATVAYDRLGGLGNGDLEKGEYFGSQNFLQTMWQQFLDSDDQLRKRVAFALSEYFVVSTLVDGTWYAYGICHYWDLLNKYAFGNFRDLLEEVTLNPSMGKYLSLDSSRKEDPKTGRLPDENYAREIMQLFTIGLVGLNIDGTPKKDAQGKSIPTYSNTDVSNIASALTGWERQGTPQDKRTTTPTITPNVLKNQLTADPMKMLFTSPGRPSHHSALEAKFLGVTIPANTDAVTAMKIVHDTLFNHPNTPPFFSKQMIQRLVTSNPSPKYIERVAKVFINNGNGIRGDLSAVFKAILNDDEALSPSDLRSQTFGKVREPFIRAVQWGRTFKLKKPDTGRYGLYNTSQQSDSLGQMVLTAPSVFNFFRPGYVPAGTAIANNKLVAPEFQIVNEVSTIGYANYIHNLVMSKNNPDIAPDYSKEMAIAQDSTALVNQIDLLLTAGQLSQPTKDKIKQAVDSIQIPATDDANARFYRVATAVFLTMVSPQYLVQK
jgi:uncharacterized protein (DUF1800 family)